MKIKIPYFLILGLFLSTCSLFAQQKKIDSLKSIISSPAPDTSKIIALQQLYFLTDSIHYAQEELSLSQKNKYEAGIAYGNLHVGRSYYFAGKEDVALNYLIQAVQIAEKRGDKKILISGYRYIGFIYRPHEPYKAKEYYDKSLKLAEEVGDEMAASFALSALGNIYEGIYGASGVDNKKALDYYERSLKIRERLGSPSEIAASLNETSRMYDANGQYQKATELRIRGLQIAEKANDKENIVFLCNLLGNDFSNRSHDYETGQKYQLKAYEAGKNLTNKHELLYDVTKAIALNYSKLGDEKNSNVFFLLSTMINDSIRINGRKYDYNISEIKQGLEKELEKQKLLVKDAEIKKGKAEEEKLATIRNSLIVGFGLLFVFAIILFRAYQQKRKTSEELANRNNELEVAYKSLALSEGNFKQITETINDVFYLYNIKEKKYEYINANCERVLGLAPSYFYEGKSMKVVVHDDDKALVVDANVKIDTGIPYEIEYRIFVNGHLRWIAEKSSPIFDTAGNLIRNSGVCSDITRRKMVEEILRMKNQDIADSIEYGSKIQQAVLVPKEKIAEKLKDFFIFLKPKEVVSGDFYFYTETKNGLIIAACDCTGHGVSGGFMSMIGNAFLHEIIIAKGITTPSEILTLLRKMIIESLNQKTGDAETNDGIDIALLNIDLSKNIAEFSGAFNSLYLIRNNETTEIKADLFPVGISFINERNSFKNHIIELQKGDSIYIGTDGYVDQFGGPLGKKFSKKQFLDLLNNIQSKKMSEQEIILGRTLQDWQGSLSQMDDVLVIGIKI